LPGLQPNEDQHVELRVRVERDSLSGDRSDSTFIAFSNSHFVSYRSMAQLVGRVAPSRADWIPLES
jgi:hypothetical protein